MCISSRHTLMNRILLLLSRHPPCHSARRAYPELQNLLFLVAKENLLPGEKVSVRADQGWRKRDLPRPSLTVCDGPPLPEGEGSLMEYGFCDFAFDSAQNDRLGEIGGRVKVFISMKPTKNESGALCIGP